MTADEFYKKYNSAAQVVQNALGIDKNTILAWWSWETAFGTNKGSAYNNLGGIKYTSHADSKVQDGTIAYSGYATTEAYAKDFIRVLSVNAYGYPAVLAANGNDAIAVTKAMNASSYAEADYNVTTIAARSKAASLVTGSSSGVSSGIEKNDKPTLYNGSGSSFDSIPLSIRLEICKKVIADKPMFEPTPIKTNFYNELKKLLT